MRSIICLIKLWFSVYPLTNIWVFFDKLNSVGHKNFKSFQIVVDVAQDNWLFVQMYFDFRMNCQFLLEHHWNITERAAAASSSLGMETNLVGVTLDFAVIKPQWIMPFWCTSLRYDTCPYPAWLVSEKWCRLQPITLPNFDGLKHLFLSNPSSNCSSLFYFFQFMM